MSLRFRLRHVQRTLADHIEAGLDELGWTSGTPPLGTVPVTFMSMEPADIADGVAGNTVSITVPEQLPEQSSELGPLREVRFPLFVDVYGERPSVSVSLASDVAELLVDLVTPVIDHAQQPPTPTDEQIEVAEVAVERPPSSYGAVDFKRNWRAVTAEVVVYFQRS